MNTMFSPAAVSGYTLWLIICLVALVAVLLTGAIEAWLRRRDRAMRAAYKRMMNGGVR
jgi:hypothetical protein